MYKMCLLKVFNYFLLLSVCAVTISGFNISPKPNLIIREPELKIYKIKERPSYFGYSLNLRGQSVIVGAPRAQSSLESQRYINETGMIYKCSLTNGNCTPFVFDSLGNVQKENAEYIYDSEKKDTQWLGAVIDGGTKETDRLVVCAPRLIVAAPSENLLHGVCYWTTDTKADSPSMVKKIAPLRLRTNQLRNINGKIMYLYSYAEMGLSAHITENNEEIIMGAPGINNWKGSLVRYRSKAEDDYGGLNRRDNVENKISTYENVEYVSDIPDSYNWNQQNDSYFGYAVSSGYYEGHGSKKIYYVASAPQANLQSGEVYLFSIMQSTIHILYTFQGKQFGEYFGYSVLSEDFNGDGLPDLAVSAPLNSKEGAFENGAVYIFHNKGYKKEFDFELNKILKSNTILPSRFGTTLGKIGDINNDGFNDIAIGAPFEGNGAVYIFLGSEKGLTDKPSQVLESPTEESLSQMMFGYGISKGVDVDSNEFNDLVVGAPNAETVYLYKSYPVVKIVATVTALNREIKTDQNKFSIRACWHLESPAKEIKPQEMRITLKVDSKINRAQFSNQFNEMQFQTTASTKSECHKYDVNVKYSVADVFKPIDIEMHYELIKKIPKSEVFCENCVAVNPFDPTYTSDKVAFNTGCRGDVCVADLKLQSSVVSESYILGSSKHLSVDYIIQNNGENSYLTQINITTSSQMPFSKIPPLCDLNDYNLLCDVHKGRPMANGTEERHTIVFDTTKLDGKSVTIRAVVSSNGHEENPINNVIENTIELLEYSEIEIMRKSFTPNINLENGLGSATLNDSIEIHNHGPSTVKNMKVLLYIPVSYYLPHSHSHINLVDVSSITVNGTHNKKTLDVVLSQNDTIIIQNVIESSTTPIVENMQAMDFDTSKLGYPLEQEDNTNTGEMSNDLITSSRKRREVLATDSNTDYSKLSHNLVAKEINESLSRTVPINRTILFNCHNPDQTLCLEASLTIRNLKPGDNIISIAMSYNIDLDQVNKILTEEKDIFVITTLVDIMRIGNEEGKTLKYTKGLLHNIISKHKFVTTPVWLYVMSIITGILILILLTYGLHKFGFFKRAKREELQKLTRESHRAVSDSEDED